MGRCMWGSVVQQLGPMKPLGQALRLPIDEATEKSLAFCSQSRFGHRFVGGKKYSSITFHGGEGAPSRKDS